MLTDWKERSEVIKNLVSTAAIIVGGLWVLYQWDTLFPKTRADVQAAAASVRTDVSGSFKVELQMDDGGSGAPFLPPPGVSEETSLSDYCLAHPKEVLAHVAPVFGQLVLKSASGIPVRARVDNIQVFTAPISMTNIRPTSTSRFGATSVPTTMVAKLTDENIFFGGLRENRVERGQEVQVAVLFDASIPVQCEHLERLVLFKAEVSLTAMDPARDKPVGSPVSKIFVTACQLNPRSAPTCNINSIEARGQ
ncbi:hypothetical protein GmRootA79_46740 [Acidovorax sp. A79]|uniref:hypothetical protein n=1 Tax=Acidovorax sp. A79 TaxID=3056107 RepID=UPI0034E896C5